MNRDINIKEIIDFIKFKLPEESDLISKLEPINLKSRKAKLITNLLIPQMQISLVQNGNLKKILF